LGNQLWGLSEAFRLANHFQRQVILDLGDNSAKGIPSPVLDFIRAQDWLEIRRFQDIDFATEFTPVSEDIYQDSVKHNFMFQGFVPTYNALCESGLFKEGVKPDFLNEEDGNKMEQFVTIHIRRGDYVKNPHLGILPRAYYSKALDYLCSNFDVDGLPLMVFGDSPFDKSTRLIPKKYRDKVLNHDYHNDLLAELRLMSQGLAFISSNSTLSYLASFISSSHSIVIPNPFYLAIPGWNEQLRSNRTIEVNYTMSKKLRYLVLRARKRMSKFN